MICKHQPKIIALEAFDIYEKTELRCAICNQLLIKNKEENVQIPNN